VRKIKKVLMFVAWLSLAAVAAASSSPLDLSGTWIGSWDIAHSGTDELTLTLTKTATGYAGIINDSLGFIAKDTAIANVEVADRNTISFSFVIDLGEPTGIGMKLGLAGDKLAGEIVYTAKGAAHPFEFARK